MVIVKLEFLTARRSRIFGTVQVSSFQNGLFKGQITLLQVKIWQKYKKKIQKTLQNMFREMNFRVLIGKVGYRDYNILQQQTMHHCNNITFQKMLSRKFSKSVFLCVYFNFFNKLCMVFVKSYQLWVPRSEDKGILSQRSGS